jgi:hypothetical protein
MSLEGRLLSGFGDWENFKSAVALSYIPGWTTFRKFGMNPDVDAGIEQVWPLGTVQVLPATAAVAAVVSDSVNDVAAGTGAHTFRVLGLDAGYALIEDEVTLTGTTPVNTTKEFLRVYRTYVVESGSLSTNAGNITTSIGGNAQAYVEAGEGQTHITQYTVPGGHTLLLDYYAVNAGRVANADLAAQFQMRLFGESWRTLSDVYPYEGLYTINSPRLVVPGKTDLRVLVEGTTTNGTVSAEYSGHLIENRFLPDN